LGDSEPTQGAKSPSRSSLARLNVRYAKSQGRISGGLSGPNEAMQSGLYYSNFVRDLEQRKAKIVPASRFEVHSQPLAMHPEIFERLAIIEPDVDVDDFLDGF
jgi:hypothetical protein